MNEDPIAAHPSQQMTADSAAVRGRAAAAILDAKPMVVPEPGELKAELDEIRFRRR